MSKLEYCPVKVRGEFDHSKEMLLGPRSLLSRGDASTQGGIIAQGNQTGVLVITPFKLADKK
jgi:surfeit locus 1 family protein